MAIPYLSTGNLHWKPASAHLLRGLLWANVTLEKNEFQERWKEKIICILSKMVFFGGAAIGIPLAVVEGVSSGIIGFLGGALSYILEHDGPEFLQKHSVKLLSHSVHSTLILVSFIILSVAHLNLITVDAYADIGQAHRQISIPWKHYTPLALGDHLLHLGSAAAVQSIVGTILDASAGRAPGSEQRVVNLFRDGHPYMLNDLLAQLQIDFNFNLGERLGGLLRGLNAGVFGGNFVFWQLTQNPQYREELLERIQQLLHEAGMIDEVRQGPEAFRFEISHFTKEEKAYQKHLQSLLKSTLIAVCGTPELYGYLDRSGTSGRDLILMCDADTYHPIAAYTQYQELIREGCCPKKFSKELKQYDKRSEELLKAQAAVRALSPSERQRLVEKIFRGGSFEAQGRVQACYLSISQLAVALHDGDSALMTKRAIDLRGGDGDLIATTRLFPKAYQEVASAIDAARAGP